MPPAERSLLHTVLGFPINPLFTDQTRPASSSTADPYGRELEPVVLTLGAWGLKAVSDPRDEQIITPAEKAS